MYILKYVSRYVVYIICMYLCTPLYECVIMKKEVQGRWGRVATRCAAIAVQYVPVHRMYVRVSQPHFTYCMYAYTYV